MVDLLQQAFTTSPDEIGKLEVHHIPYDVLGLDLLADLVQAAVVGLHRDPFAASEPEGLHVGQHLAPGIGAAPRDDSQVFLRRFVSGGAGHLQQSNRQTG